MRTVISAAFVSLDGVMQAPGGPTEDTTGGFRFGGWTAPYWDEIMEQEMGENFGQPFDLLLGRRTYDIFSAFWPYQDDPIGEAFNACTKYVATRTDRDFDWANTEVLRGDAADQVAALKKGDGPNLLIQGSSELTHSLLAAGLIDRLQLWTFPVILGGGKRLFDETSKPQGLILDKTVTSKTGVVITQWRPDGEPKTGDFAQGEPSAAERARQAAMSAGTW